MLTCMRHEHSSLRIISAVVEIAEAKPNASVTIPTSTHPFKTNLGHKRPLFSTYANTFKTFLELGC